MTEVTIDTSKEIHIIVKGHCEDRTICSCISTLSAALEGYLINYEGNYKYIQDDGYCEFKIPKKEIKPVNVFIIGILRLEKMFPKLIKVNYN